MTALTTEAHYRPTDTRWLTAQTNNTTTPNRTAKEPQGRRQGPSFGTQAGTTETASHSSRQRPTTDSIPSPSYLHHGDPRIRGTDEAEHRP
ncbi:hypothetical protein AAHC03_026372 [Spirometra sp. Aus1]